MELLMSSASFEDRSKSVPMTTKLESSIRASDVASFLGAALLGHDLEVRVVSPVGLAEAGSITYLNVPDAGLIARLNGVGEVLAITTEEIAEKLECSRIPTDNPRAAFAQTLAHLFSRSRSEGIAPSAKVSPGARLGKNVIIGEYCVVGEDVEVGAGTEIRNHVVISAGVHVGRRCLIKSHTVIGEEGFGFDKDECGINLRIPHVGSVAIGDEVELGSHNTVCRGTIGSTVIEDHVKTDDHVHIAHNVLVGRNTLITACVEISGSVCVGQDVWLGPKCVINNGITIGDGAFVGIGAVVTKSVASGLRVAGHPARKIGAN